MAEESSSRTTLLPNTAISHSLAVSRSLRIPVQKSTTVNMISDSRIYPTVVVLVAIINCVVFSHVGRLSMKRPLLTADRVSLLLIENSKEPRVIKDI
jgi:hypothetical protein